MTGSLCCCGSVSCDIASDAFTRADSTSIGAAWSEVAGDWSISSNVLTVGSSSAIARHQTAQPDAEFNIKVQASVKGDSDGDQLRVFLMWGDDDGIYAELTLDDSGCGTLELYKLINGTPTQIGGSTKVDAGSGAWHTLCICYRDHSPVSPHVTASVTTNGGVTRWTGAFEDITAQTPDGTGITGGLGTGTITSGASFDDFSVKIAKNAGRESCPLCRPPCDVFSDNFDTDNIGCEWTAVSGSWSVASSRLVASTAGIIKCEIPTPLPPYAQVTVNLYGYSTGDVFRILVDYQDANNYIYGELSIDTHLRLVQVSGGSETELDKKLARDDETVDSWMTVCLGPAGIHLAANGTMFDGTRIFSPVTTSGNPYVGLYAGTNSTGFYDFDLTVPYNEVADQCDACSELECECTLCPDDNAPPYFSVDVSQLSWDSGCCTTGSPDEVITTDCGYFPGTVSTDWETIYEGSCASYSWPAEFGGTPDDFCCWKVPIGGFCLTPNIAILYVFVTSRSGTKYVEVIYQAIGGCAIHGSVALSGNCSDISNLEVTLSNTDCASGPSGNSAPTCIDPDYRTTGKVYLTALTDYP